MARYVFCKPDRPKIDLLEHYCFYCAGDHRHGILRLDGIAYLLINPSSKNTTVLKSHGIFCRGFCLVISM